MNAALAVPTDIRLTRPKSDRECMPPATLQTLAALPPASDAEAALPEVCLLLTDQEQEVIAAKAAALIDAQQALTVADQALALAESLARRLPALRQQAGIAAARAFSGATADADAVQRASAELAQAEHAQSAIKALTEQRDVAKNAAAAAFGSLRGNAQSAVRNSLVRQGREYQRLAREQVRVVGHLLAAAEVLNDRDLLAGVHMAFLPMLSLPAPPPELISDHAAVCELNYRAMLLHPEHPHLIAHTSAARGWLQGQLHAAAELPVSRLMR